VHTHTYTPHVHTTHTHTHTYLHTQELKWSTRYHRVRSVHVTPTVFLNGLETPDISSSFTAAEWQDKINSILAQAKITFV
jgi:hypothetical protein